MAKKKNASHESTKSGTLAGAAPGADYRFTLRGWWPAAALCLLTAGLLALAFPPLRWAWLAHVALAPMLLAVVRTANKRTLAVAAALGGAAFFGFEAYWVWDVDVGGFIGMMLFFVPFWPAFAVLAYWVWRRTGLPLALVAPVLWVPLELARAYLLTGMPWFYLGHPQAASVHLLQVADLAGVYGLSALSAATAGLLVDLVTRPVFLRYGEKVRLSRSLALAAVVVAAAWVFVVGYGFYRLQPVTMRPGPLVVTVQSNVPQTVKGTESDPSYEQLTRLTRAALGQRPETDLVVWPETMGPTMINQWWLETDVAPRYSEKQVQKARQMQAKSRQDWRELHELIATAAAGKTALLVGTESLESDGSTYNTALLLSPGDRDYEPAGRYDKVHLVPFGEFVPFRESWPWLHKLLQGLTPYDYEYNLKEGPAVVRLSWAGAWFAVPICFEDSFATVCREMVYPGGEKAADFLVNISNDGWFDGTFEVEQHWDQSVFRAVENRVPVVRSVNTGISGFIDSCGRTAVRVRTEAGRVQSVEGWTAARLELDGRATVYGRHGDMFAYALCLGAIGMVIGAWGRRK
jgi:apolipoprotein N-acyltransferase